MSRLGPAMLAAMVILALPLAAQVPQLSDSLQARPADSRTWAEGWDAGRAAAGAPSVLGRAAAGFLGGLPVGFFGIVAATQGDAVPTLAAGAGIAVIGFATAPGRTTPPDTLATAAAERGATYERAFLQSYTERLSGRRRGAALVGGAAGAAAGLGLIVLLLSQLGT